MHGVTGALRDDPAFNGMACEGEIADQVENLVANELVWITQRRNSAGLARENDGADLGRPANQAHIAQHGLVFAEAESTRRSDQPGVVTACKVAGEALTANGQGEVDGVVDGVTGPG